MYGFQISQENKKNKFVPFLNYNFFKKYLVLVVKDINIKEHFDLNELNIGGMS